MGAANDTHMRAIRLWLYAVAALVFVLVLVGGATRLTESGSRSPNGGRSWARCRRSARPRWQAEFEKYQAIPQYRELNRGMSLDGFKGSFGGNGRTGFWAGCWALCSCAVSLVCRRWRVGRRDWPRLWFIFALGGAAGRRRLVDGGFGAGGSHFEVSQYRLAMHLVLAAAFYVALSWTARRWNICRRVKITGMGARNAPAASSFWSIFRSVWARWWRGCTPGCLQYLAADDGAFCPKSRFFDAPLWRNFFENTLPVQFDHRMPPTCRCLRRLDLRPGHQAIRLRQDQRQGGRHHHHHPDRVGHHHVTAAGAGMAGGGAPGHGGMPVVCGGVARV